MISAKNKDVVFFVVRIHKSNPTDEVPLCVTRTCEYAMELCGQYEQEFIDRKIPDFHFTIRAQTFYDQ